MAIDRRTMLALAAGFLDSGMASRNLTRTALDNVRGAFIAGFPLFEFARTAWSVAGPTPERPGGGFNILTHRRRLTDPGSRVITTPNNDCLVSTVRIDLSGGPLMLNVPDITTRYFSVIFMDAFTDNFFMIGTRATQGRGGKFLITPPGWHGTVAKPVTHIRANSVDLWMLVRILVNSPDEYPMINALQDLITIEPLPANTLARFLAVPPRDIKDPSNFLDIANQMLSRTPARDSRTKRAARFTGAGLRRGVLNVFSSLDPGLQTRWRDMIPATLSTLPSAGASHRRLANGWSYSLLNTGRFGDDDEQRAQIALIGLAALPPEEAFYGHALSDADGAALVGTHRYRLTIPPGGLPVNAFWSLTLYKVEPDGRLFLASNPIGRYSIGDRTHDLVYNANGSFDILMQHERPPGALVANWLPTPEGPFRPALRAYLAKPALLSLKWTMPPIERIA